LNINRLLDLDEAMELSAGARAMASEYEAFGEPVPDWLEKASGVLREEIAKRIKANKLARVRQLEARLENYKSPTEKKKEDLAELARLQRELGMTPAGRGK
jgi:hypothetical protein